MEIFARDRVFQRLVLHAAIIGLGAGAAAWLFTRVVKLGTEVAYLATSGLGLFGTSTGKSVDPDDDHHVVFRDELFDIAEPATPTDDGAPPPGETT